MKQTIVTELSTGDLKEKLEEERNQLKKLKLNHSISPLDNPLKIKEYKKTIARILTELRKREMVKK